MQEDYGSNTADFRLKANSEKSIIRCNMYVTPMGREVIFYITVGNLKSAGTAQSYGCPCALSHQDPGSGFHAHPHQGPGSPGYPYA